MSENHAEAISTTDDATSDSSIGEARWLLGFVLCIGLMVLSAGFIASITSG
ncbi:MAG: hypothetical protein AAF412_12195 [Pseudomonadota bacterium]